MWRVFIQKRLYNRETIAAINYDLEQMSFIPSFSSLQLKWLTLFSIQGSKPINDKVKGLSANGEILI